MSQPTPDSLRAVLGQVFSRPEYQWRDESSAILMLRRWWGDLTDWLGRLEGTHPALFRALIWGAIAGLIAIALHAVWVLVRTTRGRVGSPGPSPATGRGLVKDSAWYQGEAERLFAAGRYPAAMQAEFVRLTLDLDARKLLRFHPSKTPREFLPDASGSDQLRLEFGGLVSDLYRYAFAGEPCDATTVAAFRTRAQALRYAPQL